MITREQLEKKFLLKNKTVVYTPAEVPMKVRREKAFKVKLEYLNKVLFLGDARDLYEYLRAAGICRPDKNLYEEKELYENLVNNKETIYKGNTKNYKVSKHYYYEYVLNNLDYVISFKGTERFLEFLNEHKFTI